ncbi:MAG: hypothetical protein JXX14_19245 [Deltaproteobacteria bacterium]|nr:hypothetical protein [Deltaproteobacteria bacterium]
MKKDTVPVGLTAFDSRLHSPPRGVPLIFGMPVLFAFWLCASAATAGKLDNISDTVSSDDTEDEDGVSFCLFCFLGNEEEEDAAYESDTGPGVRVNSAFLWYPYADGTGGYAIIEKQRYEMKENPKTGAFEKKFEKARTTPSNLTLEDGRRAAVTARTGYWYDLDNVHLSDVRLAVDGASMAGVQLRWTEFYEQVDSELDTTFLMDLEFRVPVVTEHRGLFRLGVAGLLMHHKNDTDADGEMTMHHTNDTNIGGFLSAEVRLFPVQPLVLGADLQIGYISKAAYIRAESTAGAILGPVELYGGYQAQLFLGEHNSIISQGPGGGLRLWF